MLWLETSVESTLFWPKNTFLSETNTFNAGELFGHIVHLAFDSAGAITPQSAVFINKLYAALDDGDVPREWNSEAERIHLKKFKFFIDSLSMTIAKHRVRDIRAWLVFDRLIFPCSGS